MLYPVNAKGSLKNEDKLLLGISSIILQNKPNPHAPIAVLCSNNYLKHQKKFMVFMKAFPAHVHKPFQFKATLRARS